MALPGIISAGLRFEVPAGVALLSETLWVEGELLLVHRWELFDW